MSEWIDGAPARSPRSNRQRVAARIRSWTHYSLARCFKCHHLLRAVGTRNGGQVKRWKCPSCGRTTETPGTDIPVV